MRLLVCLLFLICGTSALINILGWDTGIGRGLDLLRRHPNHTVEIQLWDQGDEWNVQYAIWVYETCWRGVTFRPTCGVKTLYPTRVHQYRALEGSVVRAMTQTLVLSAMPGSTPAQLCAVCEPLFESHSPWWHGFYIRRGSRDTWACGPSECWYEGWLEDCTTHESWNYDEFEVKIKLR